MMNKDQQTYRRAVNAALAGGAVQLIISVALLLAALWSSNQAVQIAAWYAFGGLGIWLCIAVVFKQHALERIEALEAEQIAQRHGTDSSIFETSAEDLAVHRRRLQRLYLLFVPAISLITAGYLIGIGTWQVLRYLDASSTPGAISQGASPFGLAIIHLGVAFIAFIVSRYVAGMGKLKEWQMLRGGAAFLMGTALAAGLLCLVFLYVSQAESQTALSHISLVLPVLMIVVGAEIALNFIFNIYRPRRAGDSPRPAFDSRLLSLLTTPESLAKTINEAINYQFGFEITRSWFWQLLSKWIGALVCLGLAVLLLLSSIVIVEPHERALVTRFGQIVHTPENPPYGPGMHVKMPWPISRAQMFDVRRIRELRIGSDIELRSGPNGQPIPILWTNDHVENPDAIELLIVAPSSYADTQAASTRGNTGQPADNQTRTGPANDAPSISLVNSEMMLQYRINPEQLLDYVQANSDAASRDESHRDRRLYNIAIQQTSRFLLRHDIDQWIGTARVDAGEQLQELIQTAADREKLGVEIIGVSVASVHPPKNVAVDFQNAIGAAQLAEGIIQRAIKDQIEQLTAIAGSVDQAARINEQIERLRQMEQAGQAGGNTVTAEQLALQQRAVERAILESGGQAAGLLSGARGDRWSTENREAGRAARFEAQLATYETAPYLYQQRAFLETMKSGLRTSRKYMIGSRPKSLMIRGDLKDLEVTDFDAVIDEAAGRSP